MSKKKPVSVTKSDICSLVAFRTNNGSASKVMPIVNSFMEEVLRAVLKGNRVELRGFGVFYSKITPSKIGRNPRNKDKYFVPERLVPKFKFSKDILREMQKDAQPMKLDSKGNIINNTRVKRLTKKEKEKAMQADSIIRENIPVSESMEPMRQNIGVELGVSDAEPLSADDIASLLFNKDQ